MVTQEKMAQDARDALPYPKPSGCYTGFDSVDMHQVWLSSRLPAVRVNLKMSGKPQPAQMSDGRIVVAGFIEPPSHPQKTCTLQCSHDNAKTFDEPIVLDLPARTCGFRVLKDNSLILAHGTQTVPLVSRSGDGGKTWSSVQVPTDLIPGDGELVLGECHGPVELPDGTLLMHLARVTGYYKWVAYVIRSTDGGRTWGDPTRVPTETDSDEISYAYLHSGRILGIARTSAAYIKRHGAADAVPGGQGAPEDKEAGDFTTLLYSDDLGRTWSQPQPLGLGVLQAAGAYPLELPDGRLIVLYGNRQFPFGVQAIASRDGGMTWDLDHPIILSWTSWAGWCGHPRSVLLQDGSILTGYYTQRLYPDGGPEAGGNHNDDCTGELIRWRVPDDWPVS